MPSFDEAAFEAQLRRRPQRLLVCWYWILKLKARYLSGGYTKALAAANKAAPALERPTAFIHALDYFYYTALTLAALIRRSHAGARRAWRDLCGARRSSCGNGP